MTDADLSPVIQIYHKSIPSPLPSAPSFIFQLTRLKDTLFIWVGTGSPTSNGPISSLSADNEDETGGIVPGQGERRLAGEWGVAMPSRGNLPVTGTPIFRSGASDISVPLATRLARKFPPNQIHLSLSLPSSLSIQSGPSIDPFSSKVLLIVEKKLGTWLSEILSAEKA